MDLLVTDDHDGEGAFPEFPKGTAVENVVPNDEYPHWMECTIDDMETFIPDVYISDGTLVVEYNPTELVIAKGAVVELQKVVYEWLFVKTKNGVSGWLPASKTFSIPK